MEDPVLNLNLEDSKELHTRWSQFREFFTLAQKGGKITPEAERKFLELKTRIAMLHDSFMQSLAHDQNVGQNIMTILASCIMLKRVPLMNNAEVQKLEFDWNEAYLLIHETIAGLEEEKERLLGVNETLYKIQQVRERVTAKVHNFLVGPAVKFTTGITIGGAIVLFVPEYFFNKQFGVYNYVYLKQDAGLTAFLYDRAVPLVRAFYPELLYPEWGELDIKSNSELPEQKYIISTQGLEQYTIDSFLAQILTLGFSAGDRTEVADLIGRVMTFRRESVAIFGQRVTATVAYTLLFEDKADAKRFVELRRKGLEALEEDESQAIKKRLNICRKANFIGVFDSDREILRNEYPVDRYGFESDEMHL